MTKTNKNVHTLYGEVIGNKMNKTIVVLITRKVKHPLYGKYIKRSTKIYAHDDKNVAREGDMVIVKQVRPISRTKQWDLVEVVTNKVSRELEQEHLGGSQ